MAWKRTWVGVFIVCGAVLFTVGLFIIGNQKQVFAHHYEIYTTFKMIDTLQPGEKVRVAGMSAGDIADIRIPKTPSAPFRLKLKIDKKFRHIIRLNSVASIETEGMVGNKYVEISPGTVNSPECPPGGTLRSQQPVEMGDLMRQAGGIMTTVQATIKDLRGRADTAIQNIGNAAGNANGVIVSTRGDVKKITSNAGDILASVRHGQGTAGKLLMDKTAASNVGATLANARQMSKNLKQASRKADLMMSEVQQKQLLEHIQKTLENTQHMTAQLNHAISQFLSSRGKNENTALALRQTALAARQTMGNLSDDTEAVKHNLFLRGFFKRRGFYNLSQLTPSEYANSIFLKRTHSRACVPANGVFDSAPGASDRLSPEGRSQLDLAMSRLVSHLPNNPTMVEAYAQGRPDQAYLTSRQRAIAVRQYLESHFHLNPKLVGIMPLGDRQPPGQGSSAVTAGACIVVAISKR